MTDLVFLLLIFFVILSTLVTNNNIMDVSLPKSSSDTRPQDKMPVVSVSENLEYAFDGKPIEKEAILSTLQATLGPASADTKVQLAIDENVPHKYFVELADLVWVQGKYKITLMTSPGNKR
jgi:biopolymer transport protein ExbD